VRLKKIKHFQIKKNFCLQKWTHATKTSLTQKRRILQAPQAEGEGREDEPEDAGPQVDPVAAGALAHGDLEAGQGVLGGLDVHVDLGEPGADGVRVGVVPGGAVEDDHGVVGGDGPGAVLARADVLENVVA